MACPSASMRSTSHRRVGLSPIVGVRQSDRALEFAQNLQPPTASKPYQTRACHCNAHHSPPHAFAEQSIHLAVCARMRPRRLRAGTTAVCPKC